MADPDRCYNWGEFEKVQLAYKVKALRQLNNQSVAEYLAYYRTLEEQWDESPPDWVSRNHVLTGAHRYLIKALQLGNRLGKQRLELEGDLRAIEIVEPPTPGKTTKAYVVARSTPKDRGNRASNVSSKSLPRGRRRGGKKKSRANRNPSNTRPVR